MKIFIDTEFDGYRGDLISMALVTEKGDEWYEVNHGFPRDEWVRKHVCPVLGKAGIDYEDLQKSLFKFLDGLDSRFEFVFDWPDDARYLLMALVINPGQMYKLKTATFEYFDSPAENFKSEIPHNALSDARALALCYSISKIK